MQLASYRNLLSSRDRIITRKTNQIMYPYSQTSRDITSSINVSDDASMLHINSISLGTQPIIPQNWLYRLESHRHTHTHIPFPHSNRNPHYPVIHALSLCDIKNDMLNVCASKPNQFPHFVPSPVPSHMPVDSHQ